jgi:MFS transporter, PPP family, 3-phenylpropionic acid transporter
MVDRHFSDADLAEPHDALCAEQRARAPEALIAIQALHGLTFALYWSALLAIIGEWVPSRLRASGLALQAAFAMSLATGTGALLTGLAYDHLGGAPGVYVCAAAAELVPVGLVLLLRSRDA